MMDFHVLLYLINIGTHSPMKLWEDGNLLRIEGLSAECRSNACKMYII